MVYSPTKKTFTGPSAQCLCSSLPLDTNTHRIFIQLWTFFIITFIAVGLIHNALWQKTSSPIQYIWPHSLLICILLICPPIFCHGRYMWLHLTAYQTFRVAVWPIPIPIQSYFTHIPKLEIWFLSSAPRKATYSYHVISVSFLKAEKHTKPYKRKPGTLSHTFDQYFWIARKNKAIL